MSDAVIELTPPGRMSRSHLLIRFLIAAATAGVLHTMGWPSSILYFGLPALAAIRISQVGARRYLDEDAPRLERVLSWLLGAYAYLGLLTDRFPGTGTDEPVRLVVRHQGEPTTRSAVLRVFTSIPAILFLAVLGFLSSLLWIVAAICVLFSAHYPRSIFDFQCGVLRCHARWFGYHASLTDAYPPFTLELGAYRSSSVAAISSTS